MALTKSMTAFSGGAPTIQDAKALATEDVAALLELVDALSGSKLSASVAVSSVKHAVFRSGSALITSGTCV